MSSLTASFVTRSLRKSTTSEHQHENSNNHYANFIFFFGTFALIIVGVIIVGFCVFHKSCTNRRQKNRRQAIPTSDISSIYVVPVRSNIMPNIIEESPPSYDSVIELQERQSQPITRF